MERGNIVRLGPRVPQGNPVAAERGVLGQIDPIINSRIALPHRVMQRSDATTTSSTATATGSCGPNACELPMSNSTFTMPIVLGIVIPIVGAILTLIILQRRHVRKQRQEDANDQHASMDFGLGDVPQNRKGGVEMSVEEKPGIHMSRRQVSMDMNLTSPYLLPPEISDSKESLHSLSRTLHQEDDPYRPVDAYLDNASVRTGKKQGSSIYTASTSPSRMNESGTSELLSHAESMPRSTPPTANFVPPPRQNSLPRKALTLSPTESVSKSSFASPPYPIAPAQAHLPNSPGSPIESRGLASPLGGRQSLTPAALSIKDGRDSYASNRGPPGSPGHARDSSTLGFPLPTRAPERELPTPTRKVVPPMINTTVVEPHPARKDSMTAAQNGTFVDDESEYGDGFKVTPPSPGRGDVSQGQRYSMDVPPEEFANAGLGAPGFDPKRLSMGFRPLPPDAVNDTDDPELRANRIRSFYKEYFDDSKPAPQGQYIEDYDENYLGDATYFDPETNAFVMPTAMPFAEPITRRAMTPPPRAAPRFQGQGQPRGRNGSMGGMSVNSARGQQMYPPGPYPQGPRAFSTASGGGRRGPPGPKRPLPPPADLNTLPTPSKLKDDNVFLLGSIDFAPAPNARERVAGRSESPFGERRPYSPAVPAFAPVVSAFEELAPMPSPHMLRNSSTFTSLDFAAPRKFRDPENMSDAGSIRSNKSGISNLQLGAIRNGAYRVSRIQKDVVFTKDDLATTLKPSWGMRDGQN